MWPGSLQKCVPCLGGFDGVIDVADRLGVLARAEAFDFVEGELGAGGDDQEVVVDDAAVVELDLVLVGVQLLRCLGDELDALLLQVGPDLDGDVFLGAPVDGDPGVGWRELEVGVIGNDADGVLRACLLLHFVGCGHAADACAENDDMCHVLFPPLGQAGQTLNMRFIASMPDCTICCNSSESSSCSSISVA